MPTVQAPIQTSRLNLNTVGTRDRLTADPFVAVPTVDTPIGRVNLAGTARVSPSGGALATKDAYKNPYAPLRAPTQVVSAPAEPYNLFEDFGRRTGLVKQLPAAQNAAATDLFNSAKAAQEAATNRPLSNEMAGALWQKSYEQAAQKKMSGTTALALATIGLPLIGQLFKGDDDQEGRNLANVAFANRPNKLLEDDPDKYIIQNLAPQQVAVNNPEDLIVESPYTLRANQGGLAQFPRKEMLVEGPGTEKSDDIPAMLSDGEFVLNARSVRGADPTGQGNRYLGAKNLYSMMRDFEMRA